LSSALSSLSLPAIAAIAAAKMKNKTTIDKTVPSMLANKNLKNCFIFCYCLMRCMVGLRFANYITAIKMPDTI
jgi:uncharacterized membrane protein